MTNLIVVGVVVLIIGAAVVYMIREKKKGVKCIGCPAAGSCAGKCNGSSGCGGGCHSDTKEEN